ncbi:MAG: family 16 glycosylhydrolase [Pseudomonadota bacterium]
MWASGLFRRQKSNPLFTDFQTASTERDWHAADGWHNGAPFLNAWDAKQASASPAGLRLTLCSGGDVANPHWRSGELRTNDTFGYGRFEARFRASAIPGTVTSLFVYTGRSEGDPHDEIDIEILGRDPNALHCNYFRRGVEGTSRLLPLGFDTSTEMHTFAFEWRKRQIDWYADNRLVHSVSGNDVPSVPGKIMLNLWAVDDSASAWAGSLPNDADHADALYEWVRFTPAGVK